MSQALKSLGTELDTIRGKIKGLFDKKDPETGRYKWSEDDKEEYKKLEADAAAKQAEFDEQREIVEAEAKNSNALALLGEVKRNVIFGAGGNGTGNNGNGNGHGGSGGGGIVGFDGASLRGAGGITRPLDMAEALAKAVIEDPEFKQHFAPTRGIRINLKDFRFEAKTVMTTAAGFAPETLRNPALQVMSAQRTPVVQDLIPEIPTSQSAVVYMEETTFTNNAAPVAEGGSKPESANAWTERTVPVEVIATTLPVTDQQLEDVENIEATIRDRLTLMILLAEESQIVGGTGTSPELQGVLTKSGVQTYALNAEPVPDAIMRGITKVNVTGRARASGVVMHPNDYMDMRLLRTTDGIYIFGSPAEAGPATIWGLPIVSTDAMTENTSVVGDWRMFSRLVRRKGITIDVGFVNDDFKRNQRTIRAETRVAVVWIRPAAFCKVTGV